MQARPLPAGAALATLLAAGALLAAPRLTPEADETVRALLQEHLDAAGGGGAVVVALLDRDHTRFVSLGSSGNAARPQADEHTLFEIGSITKTFTAFLLADAVARGEVTLDDRLDRTLADRTGTRDDGAGSVTLLSLATHTSGLPRVPMDATLVATLLLHPRDPYRGFGEAELDRYLAGYHRSPKRSWAYSNLGFALLGKALERAAGKPYATLVRERVTEPLGLASTYVDVPAEQRDHLAVGHDHNGDPTPAWEVGPFAGAGAVRSTAEDLARYLDALRDPTHPARPEVLVERAPAALENRSVGLAWVLDRRRDEEVIWHNGGTRGFESFAGFCPTTGLGVVVLTNTDEDVTELGHYLLEGGPAPRRPSRSLVPRLFAACFVALAALQAARVGKTPEGRLGRLLAIGLPRGRAEAAVSALAGLTTIAVLWHLAPWTLLGGPRVRIACAIAITAISAAMLVQARRLPWVGTAGWRRVGLAARTLLTVGLLVVALRGW